MEIEFGRHAHTHTHTLYIGPAGYPGIIVPVKRASRGQFVQVRLVEGVPWGQPSQLCIVTEGGGGGGVEEVSLD